MNNSISGLSSGYYKIDEMISGLRKGNLIMACARPGVGRRQFVLNLAYNLSCDKQSSGAIFSKTICCERILDYMISRAIGKANPSVLWCYKKKLAFTKHQQKKKNSGRKNYDDSNPFDQFILMM